MKNFCFEGKLFEKKIFSKIVLKLLNLRKLFGSSRNLVIKKIF